MYWRCLLSFLFFKKKRVGYGLVICVLNGGVIVVAIGFVVCWFMSLL